MPIIIMGGILSGIFTATEAGVVGKVVYAFIIGIFCIKPLNSKGYPEDTGKGRHNRCIPLYNRHGVHIQLVPGMGEFSRDRGNVMQALTSNGTVAPVYGDFVSVRTGTFVEGNSCVDCICAHPGTGQWKPMGLTRCISVLCWCSPCWWVPSPAVGSLLYLGSSIAKTTVSKAGKEVWIFVAMIMFGNWASCDFSTDCFVFA